MKLKTLLTITAVVAFFNGGSYLIAPSATMVSFGLTTDSVGVLMSRYFGASTLAIAVLSWLGRKLVDPQARRVLVIAFFVTFLIYLVVDLTGQFTGIMNPLGWSFVITDFLIALGYGYFLFVKPDAL